MATRTISAIDPSIFRAYDIRGIVGKSLKENDVFLLGRTLGTIALEKGEKSIAAARDGRISGPMLFEALCQGLISTGCDVIDLGAIPTPLLYYATNVLETHSGVMLTGSHNPSEYNGLKIVMQGQALSTAEIKNLNTRIAEQKFLAGNGARYSLDIISRYIARIKQDVKIAKKIKIVIDCGNGIAGKVAPHLFRELGCEVIELFCEIDGNFPNHHPDPSVPENLEDLIAKVLATQADLGLAFDGDGDRLGVVTSSGEIIWPDRQLMIFAKSILAKRKGAKIIYDVKCTNHLEKIIHELGGNAIMWKTGHSFIKLKLQEENAALAGEMSGHIFFKDRWFGFDDALYAGARLLEEDVGTVFNDIPNSINTPELKINVRDDEKFFLMEKIIQHAKFPGGEINNIDGVRVNFAYGWGLVRPSNTTPCLVLRFEADNENNLLKIQDLFRRELLAIKSDLILPF